MRQDASGGDGSGRAYLREEQQVRTEFRAASNRIWISLVELLGTRWDDQDVAHRVASRMVRDLSDLAKLRCLPDGRPVPSAFVLDDLYTSVFSYGRTCETFVERYLVRHLAGEPRSPRTSTEVTALIEAFLRRYAANYEHGELTWVDELHAMVMPDIEAATWTLEIPLMPAAGGDAAIMLRIPVAALEVAGLLTGDQLILEPRSGGLWIERGPPAPRHETT